MKLLRLTLLTLGFAGFAQTLLAQPGGLEIHAAGKIAAPALPAEPAKPSEETKPAETPPLLPATTDPNAITLSLLDSSIISGKLSIKTIEIETQFGKLSVPVSSIKSFTPGLGSQPDLNASLQTLIKNLGSSNFTEREAAQKRIRQIGPVARAELQKFVDDSDTERRMRVKALLEELEQVADDDDSPQKGPLVPRDVIETTEFTIVGKIVPNTFEVTTQYGQLNIKLSDIQRAQRSLGQKEDLRKSLSVSGDFIVQRNVKNSGIQLEKGDKITITAEGSLTMTPWSNQMLSSPDGMPNCGWYIPNQIAAGALVGRIGPSGQVFKVGSKSTFTADRNGTLFIAIAMEPNNANQNFPGEYKLKIRVDKK